MRFDAMRFDAFCSTSKYARMLEGSARQVCRLATGALVVMKRLLAWPFLFPEAPRAPDLQDNPGDRNDERTNSRPGCNLKDVHWVITSFRLQRRKAHPSGEHCLYPAYSIVNAPRLPHTCRASQPSLSYNQAASAAS